MDNNTLKTWPKNERPREQLLSRGAESVSDAGLIAILLRNGLQGKDVVSFSRELLNEFGSLGALLNADVSELKKIKGLGPAKITQLLAAVELSKRQLKEKCIGKKYIQHSQDVFDYLSISLKDQRVEYFKVIYLDRKNGIIEIKELSKGTIDKALVYPREIIRHAISIDACSLIFVHNHPSGGIKPSAHDIAVTKKLVKACEAVEIDVLDHIIIGGNDYFSFKNNDFI